MQPPAERRLFVKVTQHDTTRYINLAVEKSAASYIFLSGNESNLSITG